MSNDLAVVAGRPARRALRRWNARSVAWLGGLVAALLLPAGVADGDPSGRTSSPVLTIPTPVAPPSAVGSSTLVRTDRGLSVTLETSSLEPGRDTSDALFEGQRGLVDPRRAEVILVLKTHGPKIPGLTSEMLSTFAAGCADQSGPPSTVMREGMVGTAAGNDCAEIQLSVHRPA